MSSPTSSSSTRSGGTGLLVWVAGATIVTVALEAGFIALASWALLPVIMLVLVVMALGVVHATTRLIEEGHVASVPQVESEPRSEPSRALEPRPVPARPVLGR